MLQAYISLMCVANGLLIKKELVDKCTVLVIYNEACNYTLIIIFSLHFSLYRRDSCVVGGENIFLDFYPVLEELRQESPQYFEVLTKVPVSFQRRHYKK